tara:strand:- start:241 stop:1008 length:768 start_codon:yes stop_codon:yes gene_type:complete
MKTVLITGASSGIGKEFAYLFAKNEYQIILTARRKEALETIALECKIKYKSKVHVISHDLSVANSGITLAEKIDSLNLNVDVLINNAGYGDHGDFVKSDRKKGINMLQLNMVSLTELTHIYAQKMVKRNDGKILNVASTAAFQPMVKFGIYAATKAYVLHLTEAIHFELKDTNVSVTALCPGATKTGFEEAANLQDSKLFDKYVMDAKTVAEAGYTGLMKNKMYVIPGTRNKIMSFLANATPFRKLLIWITSKLS